MQSGVIGWAVRKPTSCTDGYNASLNRQTWLPSPVHRDFGHCRNTHQATTVYPAHLPPLHTSEASFVSIRRSQGLYVDKTGYLRDLLALGPKPLDGGSRSLKHKYQFLARPRRFGKSLLVSTLAAWFQGAPMVGLGTGGSVRRDWGSHLLAESKWLWEGLDGEGWHGAHGWHPVVHLTMSDLITNDANRLERGLSHLMSSVAREWEARGVPWGTDGLAPIPIPGNMPALSFKDLLAGLHRHFGVQPVVLIDEYDAPLTQFIGQPEHLPPALAAMRSFYGVLKSAEHHLYGVFLTGISRFARVNLFSALNNLVDWSEHESCGALCGFTEQEVEACLAPYLVWLGEAVPAFARGQLLQRLREHYNGYRFGRTPDLPAVYNPYSLLECMRLLESPAERRQAERGRWPNRWSDSGTPAFLIGLAQQGKAHLPEDVEEWPHQTLSSYRLDEPDYAALMVQTGYFTFRDGGDLPLRLDFPNREVRETYAQDLLAICHANFNTPILRQLHGALVAGDEIQWLEALHACFQPMAHQNLLAEASYRAVLQSLLIVTETDQRGEESSWGGDSDLVVQLAERVYVIEVKLNRSTRAAREQVERKGYAKPWFNGSRTVIGIYLNFRRDPQGTEATGIDCEWETLYRP